MSHTSRVSSTSGVSEISSGSGTSRAAVSVRVGLFLALKTVLRGNKVVQLLTLVMLMLVFINMLFLPALLQGIIQTVNDKLITTVSSDLTLQPSTGQTEIPHVTSLKSQIRRLQGVSEVSSHTNIGTEIDYSNYATTYGTQVVDPVEYTSMFDINRYMVEGSFLDNKRPDEIVLGIQVAGYNRPDLELYASSLRSVHTGDVVTVKFSTGAQRPFTVVGIFDSNFIQGDTRSFISSQDYGQINPHQDDSASIVNVKLKNGANQTQVESTILALDSGVSVYTWQQEAGIIKTVTSTFSLIIQILQGTALIVGAITVFIVTYVDLTSKRKQIGIQRAIGLTSRALLLSYMFRALFYAIVGNILGLLVYSWILMPVEHQHPFDFPFGYSYIALDTSSAMSIMLILTSIALVSSAIPTWQALNTKIIDAIWGA